ncbi:gliding motility-associated C-terminal domain-containing protein [Adhaeribacter swui]|uniref:Gliding motility-associated C-terminal domain-containing protein n=1 Tax=Adhaeribacter swui TaxID=2086471 RepID=A0A7G7G7K4_9BACT|nr:Ig-like domain-containing protein [Adhaeribacter swui]QNF33138.1 gliding motility-associated C-terminal domain-containing protein [Adhaeribacter swui]
MKKRLLFIVFCFLFAHWQEGWAQSLLYLTNNVSSPMALDYKSYLTASGYNVNILNINNLTADNLTNVDAVIIGQESGSAIQTKAQTIKNANKPVIGIAYGAQHYAAGVGGYYTKVGGSAGGDLISANKVKTSEIFNSPNQISGTSIQILNSTAYSDIYYMGYMTDNQRANIVSWLSVSGAYSALYREGKELYYWAYAQSPNVWTETGRKLFVNVIEYAKANNKDDHVITFNALPEKQMGNAPFDLTATVESKVALTYSSSDPAVASVSGKTVTIKAVGTTNITARAEATEVYKVTTATRELIVVKGKPAAPGNLTATAGNAKADLSWTANNAADNVTGYNVYRGTAANAVNTKLNTSLVTSTTFTDETVVNNTTYYYAVTAVNADGESTKSTTVSATPTAPPVPQFTSTPVTEAIENVPYSYSLSAADGTNTQLTFSTPTLPSWLSLTQGQNTATQFGGTVEQPGGVAGDANGNIYVTQNEGTQIYKIQSDGTTTKWFNRGAGEVYAMQIYQDYLYISYYNYSTGKITKVNLNDPAAGETVVLPNVAGPLSIAIKDNYLYAALFNGGKIIKINPKTNTFTDYLTIDNPFGIGFDNNGILYIAAYGSGKVFKYNGTNLTEVLNGLTYPSDIKIDKNDNLYVSSYGGGVRKYKPDLSSFVQVSTNTQVWGMSLTPSGSLVFGDYSGNKILKLETGAVLSGTPKHSDVGTHQVSLRVSNGTETADQNFTITVKDITAPTVTISSSQTDIVKEAFDVTFTFSEEVKDFALEDITATNATVSNLQTQDNTTFTATVTPTADGEVSLQVKASTLTDVNDNANTASNEFKLLYDATAPTVVISSDVPAVVNEAFTATFTFSEDVVGFAAEDVTLTNATISAFTKVNNKTYTAIITPTNNGAVSVVLPAAKVQDNVGNDNIASEEFTRQYDATRPQVTVATTAPNPSNAAFSVTFTFSEPVSGFSIADINLVHATASDLASVSATEYTALITPTAQGEVRVSVPENKAEDVATNGNEASNELKLIFDSIAPTGYAVSFNQDKIDFDNQTKISVKVTGAEAGTDYFYEISSSGGGTSVTGTASATTSNFEISDLDVTILKDGQITFAFYQQDAAGNKGAVVTDQVTKLTRNIVSVAQPATVQVPIRTTFLQVTLPTTVEVTYTDNTKQQIAVTWQPGNYNAYIAGQYEITGALTLAPGTSNQNNLQARIIIEVQPNKVPTALALSATTFNPNITANEAIGNFSTVDPDDQEFTYALVSGAGDTNNNLFEIRQNQLYLKSNQGLSGQTQFTIRVRTTDTYNNSFEQNFTLTKAAYAKAVDQLKIVNAFTPNGDGVNDEWTVPELKFYNKVNIEVFDRSGVRLFQTTNPEKGWNGQNLNGKVLPGAYMYIIQVEDIKLTKKGVITVLKK